MIGRISVLATLVILAAPARAATLYFEAASTASTAICPAPCHEIRVFYEDSTRVTPIQAVQFELDVSGGATVATLPVSPATNGNAGRGNSIIEVPPDSFTVPLPWNLVDFVGATATPGFDALVVSVADSPTSIGAVQSARASAISCSPASVCAIQLKGLAQNRIYMGRFNVTYHGGPVSVRVGGILGVGAAVTDPVSGLQTLEGSTLPVYGFVDPDGADVWGFDLWNAAFSPPSGWIFAAGSFGGDAAADLAGYHPSNGSIWIATNTGSGFTFSSFGSLSPAAGWEQILAGDFDSDGRSDVFAYLPAQGTITLVGLRFFGTIAYSGLSPAANWRFAVGNFTGSSAADIVAYHPSNGSIWIASVTTLGISFSQVATVSPAAGWTFVAGDFNGSGYADLIGYRSDDGSLWLGQNTGSTFTFSTVGALAPASGWQLTAGDFNPGGLDDVLAYHAGSGTLWVGTLDGASLPFARWGVLAPASGWQVMGGNFATAISGAEVSAYHSSGSLWVGLPRLQGFAWPLSAAPGEEIDFHISGAGETKAAIYRHLSNGSRVDSIPMGEISFIPDARHTNPKPWSAGTGWPSSTSLLIPADWPSGVYSADLISSLGRHDWATFFVKPAPDARSRIAVVTNSNTALAYNDWGGLGKYGGAARVSFLRPNRAASPLGESASQHHLLRGELWPLGWLEAEGYAPDVFTDADLQDGSFLDAYQVLILTTHPEYWSVEMYDRLAAFLARGGSLLYLGGNGIFESASFLPDGTGMDFRLGVENGPRWPATFRYLDPSRNERSLLGVGTLACGVAGTPYEILEDHPLFAGTGLSVGGLFGDSGLNTGGGLFNGKASAWETDTRSSSETLLACGSDLAGLPPVPESFLPGGLQVIARGLGSAGAEMTFYEHPGGGFVLSTGSITFGGSLVVDAAIQQILRNALADGDDDQILDLVDVCPHYATPDRTDTDLDGRGDACECTDQNGDGRNTVSDLVAINLAIFNPGLVTPLCDGNADGQCNVNDIIAANVEIFSPGNTSTCERQPVQGP